jgi:CHAT domain-containing protein/tetratricopeptide (TPR) repeat protein
MIERSGHLDDGEIRGCASAGPGSCPEATEAHLSGCEFCMERFLRWQRAQLQQLETDVMRTQPYPDCPSEELLREVAAEIAPPDIANRTLQHSAQCDYCGPLLKHYIEIFSEELSPEIEALIQEVPSARPEHQREKAREIADRLRDRISPPKPPVPSPHVWLRSLAWSAAAASVALFGFVEGPALYVSWQISKAGKLVTIASSMRSTTEMRVPGQVGKPNEIVVKGPNDGNDWTSKPEQLSEAEAIIKRYCSTRPNANCLEIMGRISRLEAQPNSATSATADFEKAVALSPENPRLKIELAISYFDQSKTEKQPNLSKIIDLLLTALHNPKLRNEDKKAATFDLAITYERSELWQPAVDKWNEYLALDPSGPWREEALERLEKAKKQLQSEKPLSYKTPSDFVRHIGDRSILPHIEQYIAIAENEWLLTAIEDPGGDAGQAVRQLADVLQKQHSDPWLKQFAHATRRDGLSGVRKLNAAFADNKDDRHQLAREESLAAADDFSRKRNFPGLVRARFEEIYALQRKLQGSECLARAKDLGRLLADSQYGWLRIQVELEKFNCAAMISDKSARDSLEASEQLNEKYQYPELGLRISGFDAGIDKDQRRYDAAWRKAVDGLHTYWGGSYSWERLYQFYSVMWQCAERTQSFYSAQVLVRQGIRLIEQNLPNDKALQAILHLRLANNFRELYEDALAEKESSKAVSLVKDSDDTGKIYVLSAQIELAEVELTRNQPELALYAIEPVRQLLVTENVPIKQDFYRVLGKVYWKLGRLDDAVSAYQSAAAVTEKSIPDGEARLHWLVAANDIYGGLTQALLTQKKNRDALEVWERFKMLEFANRNHDSPKGEAVKLSDTASFQVRDPHLIYASFEDHLQVWILAKGDVRVQSIAIRGADLQGLARELADGCRSPDTDLGTINELEQKLYSYLIQPVLAELSPGETVVVELDKPGDELSRVKVELLKSSQNRYFSDDHTIVYSAGILVEKYLRDPLLLRKQERVLFVNGGGYLPGNELERDAVATTFPRTLFIEGKQATTPQITKALEDRVAFIYSGHALEESTGTVLAVNASTSMKAEDFQPKSLGQLRLVVLSACASEKAQNGLMDTNNLVRAFLLAGVPNVVASGWNVDSKTTARFMKKFYEGLARGESAAHALNDARKEVRSVNPHPYYWAAFSLTGRAS